jgi:peptidoglycan/LPS O-acetylase OafA/YrhL
MSEPTTGNRLDHIDAMRAIAVLLVMWTHYAELYAQIAGSQFVLDALQRSVNFGRVGVVIFFGVSGLLIPTSLRGSLREGTRKFVIRRFFRLYPAFWLSLPIGYIAYWVLFDRQMGFGDIAANLSMIPTAFGHDEVMSHYWTLETELYFYALCLALFWIGALHRMRDLCYVCAGLGVAFVLASALKIIPANALGQYKGMLYHLSIMFWGACFRQAYDRPKARVVFGIGRNRKWAIALSYRAALGVVSAVLIGIALLMAALDLRSGDMVHLSASLGYVVGIALFVLFASVAKIHFRPLAWTGEISYSIYLLHGVPLYVIYWYCKNHDLSGAPLGLYMALTVPPALALAWLSYRLVEATGIRIGHALTSSRRPPAPPAPAPRDAVHPALATHDDS